jgi:hypothetical protein
VGLGALLGAVHAVHQQGGLVAIAAHAGVVEALRAAGVDRLVFLADSLARAQGWLKDSANRGQTVYGSPSPRI